MRKILVFITLIMALCFISANAQTYQVEKASKAKANGKATIPAVTPPKKSPLMLLVSINFIVLSLRNVILLTMCKSKKKVQSYEKKLK